MFKRLAPLAVTVPLALTACWSPAARVAAQYPGQGVSLAQQNQGQFIDLSGGQVKPGYGKLSLKVAVPPLAGRRTQALDTQVLLIAITKQDGTKITDSNGKDAVYAALLSGTSATITLPGLPPSTPNPLGDDTTAYVVTGLIGDWDHTTAGNKFPVLSAALPTSAANPMTYASLGGSVNASFNYGQVSGSKFLWNALDADQQTSATLAGGTPAAWANGKLTRSGYAHASVTGDLATTATLAMYYQFPAKFQNNPATVAGASANIVSLKGLVVQGGAVSVRDPGLTVNSIDPISARNKVRLILDLEDSSGGLTFSSTPTASIDVYSATTGATSSVPAGVTSSVALSTTVTAGSNTGFTLAGKLAFCDIDFTSLNANPAAKNIVDYTISGLPAANSMRMYLLPMGTTNMTSGPFASTVFQ